MIEPDTVAHDYLALWNEADGNPRRIRLVVGWAPNARYVDPMMQGEGIDGIAAMIGGARAQFPRHVFTLAGVPDGHGGFVRFSWTLAPEDGVAVAGGTDIVRLDEANRIAEVIGFLDGAGA